MKKIPHFDTLIFGSNSFSGKHLLFFFKKKKIDVLGIYRNKKIKYKKFNQKKIDLTNKIQFKVKSNNLIIISSVHKIEDFNIDKKKKLQK